MFRNYYKIHYQLTPDSINHAPIPFTVESYYHVLREKNIKILHHNDRGLHVCTVV